MEPISQTGIRQEVGLEKPISEVSLERGSHPPTTSICPADLGGLSFTTPGTVALSNTLLALLLISFIPDSAAGEVVAGITVYTNHTDITDTDTPADIPGSTLTHNEDLRYVDSTNQAPGLPCSAPQQLLYIMHFPFSCLPLIIKE